MFTLIVLLGAAVIYDESDALQFSTQRDCMQAASAIVGVMNGSVSAACKDQNGEIVSIQGRTG